MRKASRGNQGVSAHAFTPTFIRRMSLPFAMHGDGTHCVWTVAQPRENVVAGEMDVPSCFFRTAQVRSYFFAAGFGSA